MMSDDLITTEDEDICKAVMAAKKAYYEALRDEDYYFPIRISAFRLLQGEDFDVYKLVCLTDDREVRVNVEK